MRFGVAVLSGRSLDPHGDCDRRPRIPSHLPPEEVAEAVRRMAEVRRSCDGTAAVAAVNALIV
ncbi:hypothetical protein [Saccharopolyspora spinosa]|uniref:hypothetical protein n=1 Tax=Saccharopolyspora spinosa TaxID=60894 RepID=UPI0004961127|nr:hypothetical protein [Saccharopolyspora spinosa]